MLGHFTSHSLNLEIENYVFLLQYIECCYNMISEPFRSHTSTASKLQYYTVLHRHGRMRKENMREKKGVTFSLHTVILTMKLNCSYSHNAVMHESVAGFTQCTQHYSVIHSNYTGAGRLVILKHDSVYSYAVNSYR